MSGNDCFIPSRLFEHVSVKVQPPLGFGDRAAYCLHVGSSISVHTYDVSKYLKLFDLPLGEVLNRFSYARGAERDIYAYRIKEGLL